MNNRITSFEDVDRQLLVYGSNQAKIMRQEAALNEKMQKLKDEFDEKTAEARGENELIRQRIEEYCYKNKSEFEKTRAKELVHGSVGFRTSPPKVAQLSRKYSVATSIELAKKLFKKAYVRLKEELNKDAILADYAAKKIDDAKLASVGLKIDQDEKFIIEPDWEKIPEKLN